MLKTTLLIAALFLAPCAEARIPRSHLAIKEFKQQQPCPATGLPRGKCPGWVIDHVVPLACNGPDDPSNMQWQTVADAKKKDKWERKGCKHGHRVLPKPTKWSPARQARVF